MSDAEPASAESPPAIVKVSRTRGRIRLAVQVAVLLLFVFLVLGTQQDLKTVLPHDLFFLADPLAGLSAMVASRSLILPMLTGGVAVLALTLVLGRAWCGWLCPLGSLLDWVPGRWSNRGGADAPRFWRHGKNLALFLVVFGALLGSMTLVVLDPVTVVFRSLAAAVLPLLNSVLLIVGGWLHSFGALQVPVEWFDGSVRAPLLGGVQFYLPNLTLLMFFAAVVAFNVIRRRFWCRYVCPLGGLLGVFSRFSLLRHSVDKGRCMECGVCATRCHTGAIDSTLGYVANGGECTACLDCVENCPTRAISFSARSPFAAEWQPARRQFIKSVGLAAVGAVALAFLPTPERKKQTLIRPPGSTEESLAEKCIRCGECIRVCPSGSIQPAMSPVGWDKTWSPHLVMRRGYCDYSCNACGQVCPTGAIAALTLERKRVEVIGLAAINRKTCIPFEEDRECIVCEEMCPLPQKAVILQTEPGRKAARPRVLADMCTGCGICEEQCPVKGEAAIRVLPPGSPVTGQDET